MNAPRVAVLGAGAWGTALARLLAAKGVPVTLWVRSAELCAGMETRRENLRYLPGAPIPPSVTLTAEPPRALAGAEVVISAVPSHGVREVWERFAPHLPRPLPLVASATKGIEESTLLLPTQVVTSLVAAARPGEPFSLVALAGPTFAREVAEEKPTALTAASEDPDAARKVQSLLATLFLRAYTHSDLLGAELAGALKNVIAIAAGLADGLGLGHNARAGLIVRGLAELARLGRAMGAREQTFWGLAGVGDLVLTCTGDLSRNRTVGLRLGRGEKLPDILAGMRQVAEGVRTAKAAARLAERHSVELPICRQVHAVLFEGKGPREAARELLAREPREEFD